MPELIYTNNYRHNLELYWRQFYPKYTIPVGFHVHHIKPKCTFIDQNDHRIHHPKNLVALHPDDHVAIHKCRGDKQLSASFLTSVVGRVMSEESKQARRDYKHTDEAKAKISAANKGKRKSQTHRDKISKIRKGLKLGPPSKQHRKNLSIALVGKVTSQVTKVKISKALKGRDVWNKGQETTKATKLKQSKAKMNKRLFNNGIMQKYFRIGEEDEGFVLGKL